MKSHSSLYTSRDSIYNINNPETLDKTAQQPVPVS
jgi:hypothetical protein